MNREKIDELLSSVKLNEILHKQDCEKKKSKILWICVIAGAVSPFEAMWSPSHHLNV